MMFLPRDALSGAQFHHFEFGVPLGTPIACAAVLVIAGGAGWLVWRRMPRVRPRWRATFAILRAVAMALLVFLLLDPLLVGRRLEPTDRFLVLLFDDSQSMSLRDGGERSRGERMREAWQADDGRLDRELARRYRIAPFRFGSTAQRLTDLESLNYQETKSDPAAAVAQALRDLRGAEVTAVVLVSDGAINAAGGGAGDWRDLADASVPVFTVGVGEPDRWNDLRLADLNVQRAQTDGSPVVVTAAIRWEGSGPRRAMLEVVPVVSDAGTKLGDALETDGAAEAITEADSGGIAPAGERRAIAPEAAEPVASERAEFAADETSRIVRMEFTPDRREWLEYRLVATPISAERATTAEVAAVADADFVAENNARPFLIDHRRQVRRILYFCGRPNWENKFVRRALRDDEDLELNSLLRISGAERKFVFRGRTSGLSNPLFQGFDGGSFDQPRYDEAVFLRFGPGGSEMNAGYPAHPRELFDYDLVIWGEIEHDFFAPEQLELTRDFVRKRGGTLFLLGGERGFAEGGYAGSPLEPMLPVLLSRTPDSAAHRSPGEPLPLYAVTATLEGQLSGAFALDPNPEVNRREWSEMPQLSHVNEFGVTRPGATTLATARSAAGGEALPLMAFQRYGLGKTAVLGAGATWPWQMELPADDERHERLWRQLVRYLLQDVPRRNEMIDKRHTYAAAAPQRLEFVLRDEAFDPLEGLEVEIMRTGPDGEAKRVLADETMDASGLYSTELAALEPGMHRIELTGYDEAGKVAARLEEAVLAEEDRSEFSDARPDFESLRELSAATGGEFFRLSELDSLVERLPMDPDADFQRVVYHLWQWPPFYFLLLGLFASEWALRRWKGYP